MVPSDEGVLIDSQLWISFLSGRKNRDSSEVARLIQSRKVLLAGPILFEVLVGPRTTGQRQYLQGRLMAFPLLATTVEVWLKSVELGRLTAVAIREVPFSDVLIAAHAQTQGCKIFTRDSHFDVFPGLRRHVP